MLSHDTIHSALGTTGFILGAMAVLALVEVALPLHRRGACHRAHLAPNLALTALTLATSVALNGAVLLALEWAQANRIGVLNALRAPAWAAIAVAVAFLDFSFYACHVALHRLPVFWQVHRVHHCDPTVDVTTTIRQHPAEAVIRYAFSAAFGLAIGASPGAFAVYRTWSAINGLLDHANIRVPRRLDALLALAVVTPNMHKVHHSRAVHETDTNFGNLFSGFDRAFSTFTPSQRGLRIDYGLHGYDDRELQTTWGLLALPFRRGPAEQALLPRDAVGRSGRCALERASRAERSEPASI